MRNSEKKEHPVAAAKKGKSWFNPFYLLLFAMLGLMAVPVFTMRPAPESISYSTFQQDLTAGRIRELTIDDMTIRGTYAVPHDGHTGFVTVRVDPVLADSLARYKVDFSAEANAGWLEAILSWLFPLLLFAGMWYLTTPGRQGLGNLLAGGEPRARIAVNRNTGVTFDEVAGVDEAKAELKEIIEFLKNPKEFGRLGAHIPKGILLVGPPGTGKTLLAKAVAGEAGVPFLSISGSEFIELFVGVGAARVRDLFTQAKAQAPSIIFIDELDALGRARGVVVQGGNDEREHTLNQLLAEMDGFNSTGGVVILAATNRPEILDAALLRAGRFDRQVLVDRPDKLGRRQILDVHVRRITLAPDTDLDAVAAMTTGFSGADLANLVNEAAIQATRRKASAVGVEDFTHAVERIVAGLEKKSRILTPFERRVVAYHEMGHALVSLARPGTGAVHKVSIVPRGIGALGYTIQRPTEDRYLMTRDELEDKLAVLLGGRAAEQLVFGHVSTGAADDLAKATDIVRSMVLTYGMEESLGQVVFERPRSSFLDTAEQAFAPRTYSEVTARHIDDAVRRRLAEAFADATAILRGNRAILDACVRALLETETLDEAQLKALTAELKTRQAGPVTKVPAAV